MAQTAQRLLESGAGEGVAARETDVVLRVHSYRDACGGLKSSAARGDVDIARELHDNVAQQLAVVSLLLGKLGRNRSGGTVSRAEDFYRIEEQLLRVTRDVRSLSRQGTSSPITAAGFTHAVRTLAESVRRSAGLHTILMLTEALLPDDAMAEQLYRIAQEAVHNVLRHARASSLRVIFTVEGQTFVLVVRDDGIGIPADTRTAGVGLESMASRAGTIGAQLEVRSVPGRGTAVRCVVPF